MLSCVIFIFYIIGYILIFRMFIRLPGHLVDDWALVFLAFFFSLTSWFGLLIMLAFTSKSKPPKWLTGKKDK